MSSLMHFRGKTIEVTSLNDARKKATKIGMVIGSSFVFDDNSGKKAEYTKIEINRVCASCSRIIRSRTRVVHEPDYVYKVVSEPKCDSPYCISLLEFLEGKDVENLEEVISEFQRNNLFRMSEYPSLKKYRYYTEQPSCILDDTKGMDEYIDDWIYLSFSKKCPDPFEVDSSLIEKAKWISRIFQRDEIIQRKEQENKKEDEDSLKKYLDEHQV